MESQTSVKNQSSNPLSQTSSSPTVDQIVFDEAPLVGMMGKLMSEMSEEELRAKVQEIRTFRTSSQTLRAALAKGKASKEEKQPETTPGMFNDF